jgi:hypothetical protein
MAVPTSYLTSTKNLDGILKAIRRAGVPAKFTYDFLKKLGYPSSNDRPLIPLFKAMRFIDDGSTPLDRYRRFRDSTQAKAVVAEGLREAYADVFGVDQNAHDLTNEELRGIFARLSGKSDAVAEKMALTFKSLASHADFTTPPAEEAREPDEEPQTEPEPEEQRRELGDLPPLRLHHDIHIHLPPSDDLTVHDAIFRALRQNFGG